MLGHLLLRLVEDVDATGATAAAAGDHELAAGERRSTGTILYAYADPRPDRAGEVRREVLRMSDPGC